MQGTQTHLEFIPERTTDFILAVYAEEFGLLGVGVLMLLYLAIISRGLVISANGATTFGRLMAGSITMSFFTYCFVNMGMVIGILPVVGVPLPWMSYGGTAMVTLGLGAGMLMSIHRHRTLVQS
jgi:rod shape determining protein RodA